MILPRYIGIIFNDCKDPYKTTSIMESVRLVFFFFFFVAHVSYQFFLRYHLARTCLLAAGWLLNGRTTGLETLETETISLEYEHPILK